MTGPALAPPVVELPVADVPAAQAHYRDRFGFDVAWHDPGGRIGAVAFADAAIFLREAPGPRAPVTLWLFAEDVDAVHADWIARGAEIAEPPADRPWGLRQFTARDRDGHRLIVHHDL